MFYEVNEPHNIETEIIRRSKSPQFQL